MRGAPLAVVCFALSTALSRGAAAQGDDADLIPSGVRDEAPQAPSAVAPPPSAGSPKARSSLDAKLFLEDAFTAVSAPHAVSVRSPVQPYEWQNRTSFDAIVRWAPVARLTATLSDRVNLIEQDGQRFVSDQTVRNDFREGYLTWEVAPNVYLEAGRINVRDGVALGYNPTDFFKTRSLVGQASLDPSVLRQNRLGTLMLREQAIWNGGSASVAFAPKVTAPSPIVAGGAFGLDPRFDATNAAFRMLCTLNLDVADLNPELLGYFEIHRSKLGFDVSRPVGDAVVAYAEWAGGVESNLATRAVAYGQETGTLPATAPVLPPTSGAALFRNDVAAGFSWTIATKLTVNVEYHFHQSGFTRGNWQDWFTIGSDAAGSNRAPAAVPGELWYVRGYANDQQEPVPMHQAFIRADWPKAILDDLELTAFAFVDLLDGSVLIQVSGSYYASDAWTLSAYASANVGSTWTERGSFPQRFTAIFDIVRYL